MFLWDWPPSYRHYFRICVGKYLAEASVWIAMVTMLAVFNINKAKDESGREIEIVPEFTPGVIM